MKRTGNLFERFCSAYNLLSAYKKARLGSRRNQESTAFGFHLERELIQMRQDLTNGVWSPQPYKYFDIFDPKHRTISVAAFRDRVVHHALVNVLEPVYERCFIFDSYATRKEKGTHAAVSRAQCFLQKNEWFLKTDVEKYFDSIDHSILMQLLQRKIKDRALLDVCEKIIRNGVTPDKGLPIGNLTSQFLANVYLHPLDQFIKSNLRVRYYIRYMDDFVLFSPDKTRLKSWEKEVGIFLSRQLHLSLKPSATFLNSRNNGLGFLGKRIYPGIIRFRSENLRRITRRLIIRQKEFMNGDIPEDTFLQSANSYWAMLSSYPMYGLRRSLLKNNTP